ncbi:MAG TPA: pyridoxamine 5'-phosphate oxidase family protein [Streptosporangiaceae bacterium]|jgi:hypothetical protein
MATWAEMAAAVPEIGAAGEALFYQHGVGLAFLATVTSEGDPRLHPVCPLLDGAGVYVFVVPSPKRRDLHRDGKYALHSFPCDDNEDAFSLTGRARPVADPELRAALAGRFVRERARFSVPPPPADHDLFEFHIDTALLTRTTGHGDGAPAHTVWHAG